MLFLLYYNCLHIIIISHNYIGMDSPEIVPDKLDSPVSIKIFLGIITASLIFQFALTSVFLPDDSDLIISIVSFINPLSVSLVGFIVTFRYKKSAVFGKSYLFLSLGFLSVFAGEVAYSIYDLVLNIEPYPSIADVFFFAYSPLLIVYLILNIRFFQPSMNKFSLLWVTAIPVFITVSYAVLSLSEIGEANFDFYYGIIFVAATSITLSLTLLGTTIFKGGLLGKSWLILLFGILSLTFADDWYYYLELFEGYDLSHPVNVLWYAGYWIVFYALLKHKRTM